MMRTLLLAASAWTCLVAATPARADVGCMTDGFVLARIDDVSGTVALGGEADGAGDCFATDLACGFNSGWPVPQYGSWWALRIDGVSLHSTPGTSDPTLPARDSATWESDSALTIVWNNVRGLHVRRRFSLTRAGTAPADFALLVMRTEVSALDTQHVVEALEAVEAMPCGAEALHIRTDLGFSGGGELFRAPLLPHSWEAYRGTYPGPATSVHQAGLVDSVTPPQSFWYGQWGDAELASWDDTRLGVGHPFTRAAVRYRWAAQTLARGATFAWTVPVGATHLGSSSRPLVTLNSPPIYVGCNGREPQQPTLDLTVRNNGADSLPDGHARLFLRGPEDTADRIRLIAPTASQNLPPLGPRASAAHLLWTVEPVDTLPTLHCYRVIFTSARLAMAETLDGCLDVPERDPTILANFVIERTPSCIPPTHVRVTVHSDCHAAPPYHYAWTCAAPFTVVNDTTITADLATTTDITCLITDATGDTGLAGETVVVPRPIETFLTGTTGCEGETLAFSALVNGGLAPYAFAWSGLDSSALDSLSAQNVRALASGPNPRTVYLTVTDVGGCAHLDSIVLAYHASPTILLDASRPQCAGDTAVLHATVTGSSPFTLQWSPLGVPSASDSTGIIVRPRGDPYSLQVTDAFGCTSSATYMFAPRSALYFHSADVPHDLCPDVVSDSVALTFTDSGGVAPRALAISPLDGVNVIAETLYHIRPESTTTYTFTLTDSLGCAISHMITVHFAAGPCSTSVREPIRARGDGLGLAAYPNPLRGDGVIVYRVDAPGEVSLAIVDALGRTVRRIASTARHAGEQTVPFDGRASDGNALPSGLYTIVLDASGHRLWQPIILQR